MKFLNNNLNSIKEQKEFGKMQEYSKHLNLIQKAMFNVVNEKKGTANKSKSLKFEFSGKVLERKFWQ